MVASNNPDGRDQREIVQEIADQEREAKRRKQQEREAHIRNLKAASRLIDAFDHNASTFKKSGIVYSLEKEKPIFGAAAIAAAIGGYNCRATDRLKIYFALAIQCLCDPAQHPDTFSYCENVLRDSSVRFRARLSAAARRACCARANWEEIHDPYIHDDGGVGRGSHVLSRRVRAAIWHGAGGQGHARQDGRRFEGG